MCIASACNSKTLWTLSQGRTLLARSICSEHTLRLNSTVMIHFMATRIEGIRESQRRVSLHFIVSHPATENMHENTYQAKSHQIRQVRSEAFPSHAYLSITNRVSPAQANHLLISITSSSPSQLFSKNRDIQFT